MQLRILLLVLLVGAGVVAWSTGLHEQIEVERLRELLARTGFWGPLLFVLLFGLEGIGVPGVFFMMTAVALWPPWLAFLLNWLGAIMAGIVGFAYARYVGRDWVAAHLPARMRRFEARVVDRSVQTVIVIRLLFFLAPPAHWALGLSPVGFRPFVIGSAIGFAPAMLLVSFAGRPAFAWLSRQSLEIWLALGALFPLGVAAWWLLTRRNEAPADPGD
jgi:uncharacterized membrane protein YdjX (TVP38/TMEM64 family)